MYSVRYYHGDSGKKKKTAAVRCRLYGKRKRVPNYRIPEWRAYNPENLMYIHRGACRKIEKKHRYFFSSFPWRSDPHSCGRVNNLLFIVICSVILTGRYCLPAGDRRQIIIIIKQKNHRTQNNTAKRREN